MIKDIIPNSDLQDGNFECIIDAAGKFVIPGMINCHTHLGMNASAHPMNVLAAASTLEVLMQAIESGQKMLKKGITTVRDCGAKEFEVLLLRDKIKQGIVPGPRILASQAIKMTGGHFTGRIVDGLIEVRKGQRTSV